MFTINKDVWVRKLYYPGVGVIKSVSSSYVRTSVNVNVPGPPQVCIKFLLPSPVYENLPTCPVRLLHLPTEGMVCIKWVLPSPAALCPDNLYPFVMEWVTLQRVHYWTFITPFLRMYVQYIKLLWRADIHMLFKGVSNPPPPPHLRKFVIICHGQGVCVPFPFRGRGPVYPLELERVCYPTLSKGVLLRWSRNCFLLLREIRNLTKLIWLS